MPIYEFGCPCGNQFDTYRPLSAFSRTALCPVCNGPADLRVSTPHSSQKEYHTPIIMHSIGCTSTEQIQEMQRAGVTISDDPNNPDYGIPIAHSRHEKLKALKVAHFTEVK